MSQFHNHAAQLLTVSFAFITNGWPQQELPQLGFRTHTTALWPVEQSSILSAKIDCPVASYAANSGVAPPLSPHKRALYSIPFVFEEPIRKFCEKNPSFSCIKLQRK